MTSSHTHTININITVATTYAYPSQLPSFFPFFFPSFPSFLINSSSSYLPPFPLADSFSTTSFYTVLCYHSILYPVFSFLFCSRDTALYSTFTLHSHLSLHPSLPPLPSLFTPTSPFTLHSHFSLSLRSSLPPLPSPFTPTSPSPFTLLSVPPLP